MKKPLLFPLFVWLVLLAIPTTRPMVLLDWKRATTQRLSEFVPGWAPRDEPSFWIGTSSDAPPGTALFHADDTLANERAGEMEVAPPFAALARSSTQRDALLWCALSPVSENYKARKRAIAANFESLERRFPGDATVLACSVTARTETLSLDTRAAGPLMGGAGWSVRARKAGSGAAMRRSWDALARKIRRGQKMEPRNGFWWWMETVALLGARRDEQVWPVLGRGARMPFDAHARDLRVALWRARVQSQGVMPVSVALSNLEYEDFNSLLMRNTSVEQVCENIIGARLLGRHKIALEGGRDLVRMGRSIRQSDSRFSYYPGSHCEDFALKHAQVPGVGATKRVKFGASAAALAGHPNSLLRYAAERNRPDVVRELTAQWNDLQSARRADAARWATLGKGSLWRYFGLNDRNIGLAAGFQNTGSLLVATLPVPLLLLTLGWLRSLWRPVAAGDERDAPRWTRGLGWSAFSLGVLLAANFGLSHMVWRVYDGNAGTATPLSFDAMLPRLVEVLPSWAFGFPTVAAWVGALWAGAASLRRQNGELPLRTRLKNSLSTPDERMETFDAHPLLQTVALGSAWLFALGALAAWFYWPQVGALEAQKSTLHNWAGGLGLGAFWLAGALPAFFWRPKNRGGKRPSMLLLRSPVWRRFLCAHIALATLLYLACNIGGAIFSARFETQWNRVFAPTRSGNK